MGQSYDLLKDFGGDANLIAVSPYAIILIVGYKDTDTFDNEKFTTKENVLKNLSEEKDKILITTDINSISVNNDMGSHLKTMQISLKPGLPYLNKLETGDWIMCWMVNNETKFNELLNRIKNNRPCNRFTNYENDGLKFVGKVSEITKNISNAREVGLVTSEYVLSCTAFKEFDCNIHYDMRIASENEFGQINKFWGILGVEITRFFANSIEQGRILQNNMHEFLPTMINLVLGKMAKTVTVPGRDGASKSEEENLRPVFAPSVEDDFGNVGYIVPKTVAKLLSIATIEPSITFPSILEGIVGIQTYEGGDTPGDIFSPKIESDYKGVGFTGDRLLGAYFPQTTNLFDVPLWSIINQYVNAPINQMYTCLRVNKQGVILPTIIVRQLPLSSPNSAKSVPNIKGIQKIKEASQTPQQQQAQNKDATQSAQDTKKVDEKELKITRFVDLPRWKLPKVAVVNLSLTKSDESRLNYVQLLSNPVNGNQNSDGPRQGANNPPIIDVADVKRNGVRSLVVDTHTITADNILNIPRQWAALFSDCVIGMHKRLSATIVCQGIVSPICEGDNLEFEGYLFHIENINHNFQFDRGSGNKRFVTIIRVRNGIPLKDLESPESLPDSNKYRDENSLKDEIKEIDIDLNGFQNQNERSV